MIFTTYTTFTRYFLSYFPPLFSIHPLRIIIICPLYSCLSSIYLSNFVCTPRDGPEFEFPSDENAPENTQQTSAPGLLRPEANTRKDPSGDTTAFDPKPGKENVAPQEDDSAPVV